MRYAESMGLSSSQKSLLVAMPVLVGSLGRILAGALTDRFGGRLMFTVLLLATAPFVLLVAFAGNQDSYGLLLLFGFFLGIAGTTFAVGIPFVNAWFEADRRGFATGVFGAGMGGTALSAFFTPAVRRPGSATASTHVIIAVGAGRGRVPGLDGDAGLARLAAEHRPGRARSWPRPLKLPVTWQMSFLYAVAFGGFVAFSTYLPTYLKDVYDFDLTEAGTRTAGFAIAAVIARPIGGVLSDRIGPRAGRGDVVRGRRRAGRRRRAAAGARGAGRPDVRADGGLPRPRHRRRLRLGRRDGARRSGSAVSPASSAPPVASAGSSRRWSWARRTTRRTTATRSA